MKVLVLAVLLTRISSSWSDIEQSFLDGNATSGGAVGTEPVEHSDPTNLEEESVPLSNEISNNSNNNSLTNDENAENASLSPFERVEREIRAKMMNISAQSLMGTCGIAKRGQLFLNILHATCPIAIDTECLMEYPFDARPAILEDQLQTKFSCGSGPRLSIGGKGATKWIPAVYIVSVSEFVAFMHGKHDKDKKGGSNQSQRTEEDREGHHSANGTCPNWKSDGVFDNARGASNELCSERTNIQLCSAADEPTADYGEEEEDNDAVVTLEGPWCMVTNFYAPRCPFSARLAPFYNALPRLFPKLFTVAVDATEYSILNNRYGISGTPTLILWHNGKPVARHDGGDYSMEALKDFVTQWTELTVSESVELEVEGDYGGPLPTAIAPGPDYHLWASWIFIVLCSLYYGHKYQAPKVLLEFIRTHARRRRVFLPNFFRIHRAEAAAGGLEEGEEMEEEDGDIPNLADGTTPNLADGDTPNSADGDTPNPADGTTPNQADGNTPNPADGNTPNSADETTPNPADANTPNLADDPENIADVHGDPSDNANENNQNTIDNNVREQR